MKRRALAAAIGAMIGGVVVPLVSNVGGEATVNHPVHMPGTSGYQDLIRYDALVFKFALVLGTCSGAIAGAVVGAGEGRGRREP